MKSPLRAVPGGVSVPLSWVYGAVVVGRNRWFDGGARSARIEAPVISVGNITTGGVGKTPFVAWLARRLVASGLRPVIAMRGYGAAAGEKADEHAEYEELLPAVPVVADPDRTRALRAFLASHPEFDAVLLDDGFQHRRLHRDLDLVLVDATRSTPSDRLLPAGSLREPIASLRRADAVIVTRARAVDPALAGAIERAHGAPPLAWSRHAWTHLRLFEAQGDERRAGIEWLAGRRVITLLGVGNPAAILDQLREAGAAVAVNVPARDHERYTAARLEEVRRRAAGLDALVVTGKDWVRVRRRIDLSHWPVPIVAPAVEIEVFEGEGVLTARVLGAVRRPV